MSKGNKLQPGWIEERVRRGARTTNRVLWWTGMCYSAPNVFITERWLAPWIVLAAHRCSSLSFLLLPFLFSTSLILHERTRRHRHTCPQTRTAGSLLSQVWKTKLQQMVVLVPEQRGSTVPSPWSHTHTRLHSHSLCLCLACPFFLSLRVSVMFIKNMIPSESVNVLHSDLQRAATRFTHLRTYTLPCYLNEDTSRHLLFLCNN